MWDEAPFRLPVGNFALFLQLRWPLDYMPEAGASKKLELLHDGCRLVSHDMHLQGLVYFLEGGGYYILPAAVALMALVLILAFLALCLGCCCSARCLR